MFLTAFQTNLAAFIPAYHQKWLFATVVILSVIWGVMSYLRSSGYQNTFFTLMQDPAGGAPIPSFMQRVFADLKLALCISRGLISFAFNAAALFALISTCLFVGGEVPAFIFG